MELILTVTSCVELLVCKILLIIPISLQLFNIALFLPREYGNTSMETIALDLIPQFIRELCQHTTTGDPVQTGKFVFKS